MIARKVNKLGIVLGLLFTPTLFKKPSFMVWIPFFLLNGIINHTFNKVLVKTGKIKYPIRLLPSKFKTNVVYDYLICPYISVWFCQSSFHDNFIGVFKKVILWGTPQIVYELYLERKTKALKFKRGWKWFHTLFLVYIVKLITRGLLQVLKILNALRFKG